MSNQNKNTNEQHWMLLVSLLDEIRQEKKLTITETAVRAGIPQGHVSRFFSCKFEPKLSSFLKIAKAIKVNFFFEDQEDKSDLNQCFERAMESLGRRVDKLPKN